MPLSAEAFGVGCSTCRPDRLSPEPIVDAVLIEHGADFRPAGLLRQIEFYQVVWAATLR
jgi:hypothetical protein